MPTAAGVADRSSLWVVPPLLSCRRVYRGCPAPLRLDVAGRIPLSCDIRHGSGQGDDAYLRPPNSTDLPTSRPMTHRQCEPAKVIE